MNGIAWKKILMIPTLSARPVSSAVSLRMLGLFSRNYLTKMEQEVTRIVKACEQNT